MVRTSTSPGRGAGTRTLRISPTPGSHSQKASASLVDIAPPRCRSGNRLNSHRPRAVLPPDGLSRGMNGVTVPAVQGGTTSVLLAHAGVLVALAATVGLGVPGWATGLAFGVLMATVRSRLVRLGPADRVTMGRAALAGGVAALTADSFQRPAPVGVLVTLTSVALVLDCVDGQVARRTGTVSALGARLDMEVDAFLLLALSVAVAPTAGAWVLAIGGMRYAFAVGEWSRPWIRVPLPVRPWHKTATA